MILATTTVENVDRFLEVFGAKGADKRALHGSKGSTVFRDPSEENRVWALFDWDEHGWTKLRVRPRGPADHAGSRTQGEAAGRAVRRPVRRLTAPARGGDSNASSPPRPPDLRESAGRRLTCELR